MNHDAWNPDQYEKFRAERIQPFFDLIALIDPRGVGRAVDIGCGTGELTVMLAERLPGAIVHGVDSSPAMLQRALPRASARVSFQLGDAAEFGDWGAYDLVFSHAALQWVPDNEALMRRALGAMRAGAQIAVQVPKNAAHPSHAIAAEIAQKPRFRSAFPEGPPRSHALTMERYAELLFEHGFQEQVCFEKIYGHVLSRTEEVVEWVKGTLLTAYLSRLNDADRAAFLEDYRERLLATLGNREPYFYPFRRMLFWGRKV